MHHELVALGYPNHFGVGTRPASFQSFQLSNSIQMVYRFDLDLFPSGVTLISPAV